MKWALTAMAVLYSAAAVSAAPLIYEGFNYTGGQELTGNTNPSTGNTWLQAAPNPASTSLADINTISPGLTAMGYGAGGAVAITGNANGSTNGGADRLALPSQITSGTVYYSFAMRVDSLDGSNNGIGAFFIGLNNTGNSSQTSIPNVVGARLQARIDPNDANQYDLGIFANHSATAAASSWSAAMPVDGSTIFVVAAYTFNSSTNKDDVASLWINPGNLGDATPPAADFTDTGGTDLADVGSILLRQSVAPHVTLDELRVGTSWEDVTTVPEPACLGLVALAGLVAGSRRRIDGHC